MGTVQTKNDQTLKQSFLFLLKYQHVADVVVEFYGYATCVKGVRGNEPNGQTVQPTQLILISIEAETCAIQNSRVFFSNYILVFEIYIFSEICIFV